MYCCIARGVLPERVGLVVALYERPRLRFAHVTGTSTSQKLQQGGMIRLVSNREPRHQETYANNGRLRILVSYIHRAHESSYDMPGTRYEVRVTRRPDTWHLVPVTRYAITGAYLVPGITAVGIRASISYQVQDRVSTAVF